MGDEGLEDEEQRGEYYEDHEQRRDVDYYEHHQQHQQQRQYGEPRGADDGEGEEAESQHVPYEPPEEVCTFIALLVQKYRGGEGKRSLSTVPYEPPEEVH